MTKDRLILLTGQIQEIYRMLYTLNKELTKLPDDIEEHIQNSLVEIDLASGSLHREIGILTMKELV